MKVEDRRVALCSQHEKSPEKARRTQEASIFNWHRVLWVQWMVTLSGFDATFVCNFNKMRSELTFHLPPAGKSLKSHVLLLTLHLVCPPHPHRLWQWANSIYFNFCAKLSSPLLHPFVASNENHTLSSIFIFQTRGERCGNAQHELSSTE